MDMEKGQTTCSIGGNELCMVGGFPGRDYNGTSPPSIPAADCIPRVLIVSLGHANSVLVRYISISVDMPSSTRLPTSFPRRERPSASEHPGKVEILEGPPEDGPG